MMDQYKTHTATEIQAEAESLGIEIFSGPRGGTGRYQPLDRRTFGALKSQGRAKWGRYFNDHYGTSCMREIAAELLLESGNELSDSVVTASWDEGESFAHEDADEPEDTDGEFESGDERRNSWGLINTSHLTSFQSRCIESRPIEMVNLKTLSIRFVPIAEVAQCEYEPHHSIVCRLMSVHLTSAVSCCDQM
jgi:hypothetical protein